MFSFEIRLFVDSTSFFQITDMKRLHDYNLH